MPERLGAATRNRQADSLGGTFYGGGSLKIYTGTQPATADTAATGTLLCTITLPATPFGAAGASQAGQIDKAGTWSATAGDTGTAGWFRIQTVGSTHPIDGVITITGGGGDLELATLSLVSGVTVVTISAFTIYQPAS